MAKLTGAERYVDDLPIDNCLWGMTVRSPVARGWVKELRFGKNIDWSQFVIVDHRDIPAPGANEVYLIERDQPVLAGRGGALGTSVPDAFCAVRHMHEAIAL